MDTQVANAPNDTLEVAGFPVIKEGFTIAQSGEVLRGSLLGKVTATGELKLLDAAAADGSEDPYAILAETVDTTSAAKVAPCFLSGAFNKDAIIVGGATVIGDLYDAMRIINLYQRDTTLLP